MKFVAVHLDISTPQVYLWVLCFTIFKFISFSLNVFKKRGNGFSIIVEAVSFTLIELLKFGMLGMTVMLRQAKYLKL